MFIELLPVLKVGVVGFFGHDPDNLLPVLFLGLNPALWAAELFGPCLLRKLFPWTH